MIEKARIKKILLVAPNWIGDAVMALPAISLIRDIFPFARITILGLPHISDLFRECPFIDEIKTFRGLLTAVSDIKSLESDMAILFPNSFRSALITRLARIPLRCGYNRDGRGFLVNIPVNFDADVKRLHQIDYYLNLARSLELHFSLGATTHNPSLPPLNKGGSKNSPLMRRNLGGLNLSMEEKQQALHTLHKYHITTDAQIIGINPGAAYGSSKRWHPERYGHLAEGLAKSYNAKVIVFGSRQETDIADEIVRTAGVSILNMAGRTSIRELMSLISCCRVFITNDSGPMHIATALGVPVVAIFGSTDSLQTGPLGDEHIVIKKDVHCSPCFLRKCPTDLECMDLITVDDVLEGVKKIL